jgi:hypothetical protein
LSATLPVKALQKAATLQCLLTAVNTRFRARLEDRVSWELDNDWRYVQHFMAPEWLCHLSKEPEWKPSVGVTPGMMVSSLQFIVMDMTVANVTAWLDENWGTSPAEVDEAFDLIQSYLYSTLKSQEGKAKAQRLLTQLRQMSKR